MMLLGLDLWLLLLIMILELLAIRNMSKEHRKWESMAKVF